MRDQNMIFPVAEFCRSSYVPLTLRNQQSFL